MNASNLPMVIVAILGFVIVPMGWLAWGTYVLLEMTAPRPPFPDFAPWQQSGMQNPWRPANF